MPHPDTRLEVNINRETQAALLRISAAHDISITEAVRRAVGVYDHLDRELADPKAELKIHNKRTRSVTKLTLLS